MRSVEFVKRAILSIKSHVLIARLKTLIMKHEFQLILALITDKVFLWSLV